MSLNVLRISLALLVALTLGAGAALAEGTPSAKSAFSSGSTEVLPPNPSPVTILAGELKTSNVGDLSIGVSLECALWTSTHSGAKKGGGKDSSTSRAAVYVTAYVDGVAADPGEVVFCDREQQVDLQFKSGEISDDEILLDLFLRTKNANHFNFYKMNVGTGVHQIVVKAASILQSDPDSSEEAQAVVGKRSLIVEEVKLVNK